MRRRAVKGQLATAVQIVSVLLAATVPAPAHASCSGPRAQLGCGDGAEVSPSCAVTIYLTSTVQPSAVVVAVSGDGGAALPLSVSAMEPVNLTLHMPYYHPQTCELLTETFTQSYYKYRLSPQASWPVGQLLQVTVAGAALGGFRPTTAGGCPDATPQAPMCGSGSPAPVAGCPKSTDSGGCAISAIPGQASPAALLVVLVLLVAVRVRRRQ